MDKSTVLKLKSFTVLYVEDEVGIRKNIFEILNDLFKEAFVAKNANEAYSLYTQKKPDLIITDIKMPKETGIDLAKKIRKTDSKVRIIITSAHTDLEYMLDATELHLVKYIIKPITEGKLFEAFEAFIKSYHTARVYNLNTQGWLFDESKSLVQSPKKEFKLTKKENMFLKLLIQKNRIITYEEMENIIWNDDIMTPNAMRLFIKNFRKKLPSDSLKNVQGTGYRLVI